MNYLIALVAGLIGGIVIGRTIWPKVIERERIITKDLLEIPAEVKMHAIRLVADVEAKFSEMEGEFKRAQVYRALINIFPNVSKKILGLAIEVAQK